MGRNRCPIGSKDEQGCSCYHESLSHLSNPRKGTDPPPVKDWRWKYPTRHGTRSWKEGKWTGQPFVRGVGLV